MTSAPTSPLAEASASSLDEYFARKPPYDAQTLNAIKQEFRRLRANWAQDAQTGKVSKARKASKVETTKSVDFDLFAAEDTPTTGSSS
jgi:hypothetical protein